MTEHTPESLEARLEREVVASGIPQEVAVAEHYKAVAEDAIAALKEARADAESWYEQREMMLDSWAEMKQECDEARAENQRLREALERIASDESFVGHALSPVIMSDAWVEEAQAMQQHAKDALHGYDPEDGDSA